jgi:hypothetical protein
MEELDRLSQRPCSLLASNRLAGKAKTRGQSDDENADAAISFHLSRYCPFNAPENSHSCRAGSTQAGPYLLARHADGGLALRTSGAN